MSFQFATCEPARALQFIKTMYPSRTLDEGKFPLLMKLIGEDVLRVQDPDFHQPCQIVAGNQYSNDKTGDVNAAIAEFKGYLADMDREVAA